MRGLWRTSSVGRSVLDRCAGRILLRSSRADELGHAGWPAALQARRWMSDTPPHTVLEMPKLSPTMETGTIAQWLKKEGDAIAEGDSICEVETDKATVSMDATEDAFLAKVLVPEGTQDVSIGTPIAVTVESEELLSSDFSNIAVGGSTEAAPAASAPELEPAQSAPAKTASYPEHKLLEMPVLSPTPGLETGNLVEWSLKEGDQFSDGDVLAVVETDKATMDFQATDDGYLAKILVPAGTNDVRIGSPVAITTEDPVDPSVFDGYELSTTSASEAVPPAAAPEPEVAAPVATPPAPAATSTVQPTWPSTGQQPSAAEPDAEFETLELTKYRKVTAARLAESKRTIPHYYVSADCRIDRMAQARNTINSKLREGESKVSVNDFVLKAAALALRQVPEVNSQWAGDAIRQMHNVDICVAVQTDRGLITPIVFGTDGKGLKDISKDVRRLAGKAKENKLQPEEFMGGTFTVSNLGMFGVDEFSAVINPPQAGILAVGGLEKRVVFEAGSFEEAQFMTVTLSCDHRIVDGAIGARWLQAFKDLLEDPMNML